MLKFDSIIETGEQGLEALKDQTNKTYKKYKNKTHKTYKKFTQKKADSLAKVIAAEEKYLEEFYKEQEEKRIFGLALSGGGIRSAAFSIGIIQALDTKKILEKTSYLSTVSGGGFAGSALTWYLTEENVFPFGHKATFSGSQEFDIEDPDTAKEPDKPKEQAPENQNDEDDGKSSNKILSNIRQHGNYLTPFHIGKISLAARGLLSIAHSAFSYLLAFSFILFWLILGSELVSLFLWEYPVLIIDGSNFFSPLNFLLESYRALVLGFLKFWANADVSLVGKNFTGFYFLVALIAAFVFVINSIIFGWITFWVKNENIKGYRKRVRNQRFLGFLLVTFLGSLIISVLPVGYEILVGGAAQGEAAVENTTNFEKTAGPGGEPGVPGAPTDEPAGEHLANIEKAASPQQKQGLGQGLLRLFLFLTPGVIGAILAIYKFRKDLSGEGIVQNRYFSLAMGIVVMALIFSVLSMSFTLAEFYYNLPLIFLILVLIFAFFIPLVVDINLISLHRMYRDRLAETFLWDPSTQPHDKPHIKGNKASQTLLKDFATPRNEEAEKPAPLWVPYHLINTNVVFTNAQEPKFRGRRGDNFILSPLYCGSISTRYEKTEDFLGGRLTLATAMATSGAAVNPNAGVSGRGFTVNPLMSFLMTFFGLRLGLWVLNPAIPTYNLRRLIKPNYLSPGFRSLLGVGQKENSDRIELTDGGHFDNTGLYELIRRRVPNIILCDGAADQKFTFDDLGNALERVRVDFGVLVKFDKNYKLSKLIPGSYETHSRSRNAKLIGEKYGLSQSGLAIARIIYPKTEAHPEENEGRLFYFKAVMVDDLPADIVAYKAKNPTFPSQSTVDQFFDERQFESYRELGYRLAKPKMRVIHSRAVKGRK